MTGQGGLLLCSGGLDSAALLTIEHSQSRRLEALFFDYGQLNAADELAAARRFCGDFGVPLHEAALPGAFPPSGLTAEGDDHRYLAGKSRFFLPMRNGAFLTLAVSWAMRLGCDVILIGSVAADRTHLDSGPHFFAAMDELVTLGSGGTVRLEAPLAAMRKGEVMDKVRKLGDPARILEHSWSCYFPRSSAKVRRFAWGEGCGACLSCRGRRAALAAMA